MGPTKRLFKHNDRNQELQRRANVLHHPYRR
jgi:hypothetical protein